MNLTCKARFPCYLSSSSSYLICIIILHLSILSSWPRYRLHHQHEHHHNTHPKSENQKNERKTHTDFATIDIHWSIQYQHHKHNIQHSHIIYQAHGNDMNETNTRKTRNKHVQHHIYHNNTHNIHTYIYI